MADLPPALALGGEAPASHSASGVELREHPFVPMLRLQALRADIDSLGAGGTVAPAVLPSANRAAGEDPWLLWRAPGDWLAYSLTAQAAQLEATLRSRLAAIPLLWMDVSSTGALFEIRGPRATEVLMRDCTLDLEGQAVPAGACAQTPIAQLLVMIHRPAAEPLYRLWVDRSAARHLWAWLVDTIALAPASPRPE